MQVRCRVCSAINVFIPWCSLSSQQYICRTKTFTWDTHQTSPLRNLTDRPTHPNDLCMSYLAKHSSVKIAQYCGHTVNSLAANHQLVYWTYGWTYSRLCVYDRWMQGSPCKISINSVAVLRFPAIRFCMTNHAYMIWSTGRLRSLCWLHKCDVQTTKSSKQPQTICRPASRTACMHADGLLLMGDSGMVPLMAD